MGIEEFREKLNSWGRDRVPFLFVIDFELEKPIALKLDEVDAEEILFAINGFTNCNSATDSGSIGIHSYPISFQEYKLKFDTVYKHLAYGDSYLTNLTISTPIEFKHTLREIYVSSRAPYKILYKDQFLVFSPEGFIKIKDNHIYSFPMKGTIDAAILNASEIILNNQKEKAEHVTIVDLIRNDVSSVAKKVRVNKFRYLDEIKTTSKNLLQVSSEIVGDLENDWHSRIGDILLALLPAGSISGAPKKKTLAIISEAEQEKRGYYTGVFGYFNGEKLESGVMIRYIEKKDSQYFYRSGGGITAQSNVELEYQEAIDKVYVPII